MGEYCDDGISARKAPSKRPALQRLLADLNPLHIELIAFTKLDRWTRNVKGYYQIQDELDRNNVAWIAIQEDYETVTASGRFKVNIMLSVAENEADRTSERIKSVVEHKVLMGEAVTGSLPLGLAIENKRIVHGEKIEAVRAAFDMFVKTANLQKTRDYLDNVWGVSLPPRSVRTMLRNELYVGRYRGNTDYCAPAIDENTFAEAQFILSHRTVRSSHNHTYLFSGIIFCGECGHRMTGAKGFAYRCNNCCLCRRCENNHYANERKIEQYLLTHLSELVAGHNAEYQTEARNEPKINRAAIQRKLNRLKELYVDGDISREKYKEERDKLAPLLAIKEKHPKPQKTIVLGNDFALHYRSLSDEQKQQFWRSIIDSIVVDKNADIRIFLR